MKCTWQVGITAWTLGLFGCGDTVDVLQPAAAGGGAGTSLTGGASGSGAGQSGSSSGGHAGTSAGQGGSSGAGHAGSSLAGQGGAPETVPASEAIDVSFNGVTTYARLSDGRVACWGDNAQGLFDDGTLTSKLRPTLALDLDGAAQIVPGGDNACGRWPSGDVKCWGYLDAGTPVGETFDPADYQKPTLISGLHDVAQLASSGTSWCARLTDGTVRCWGENNFGELGLGDVGTTPVPTAVAGLAAVTDIKMGAYYGCALHQDGTVACWGWNNEGQLGDGTTQSRSVPGVVKGLAGAVQIAVDSATSCALLADGSVACWGILMKDSQNGDSYPTPVPVAGLSGVVQVAVGNAFGCALRSDGTVACWGYNPSGALGDGTTVSRPAVAAVPGLTDAVQIVASSEQSCARRKDGSVVCWGKNDLGQLGDGTTTNQTAPTPVLW